MGGETSSNSPKPSSSAAMEFWTLVITIVSAMDIKAHDVYLIVSLSGDKRHQKRRSPILKAGSNDPWSGHTFEFTVDEAAALDGCLKFKIKKAKRTFCLKRDVGEVDVPVTDLLVNGSAGDAKPKVLSCEVRSSSGETQGVLQFHCRLDPPLTKKAGEPARDYPAAGTPPASGSAAAYLPPVPGAVLPPPSGYPLGAYPPNTAPDNGYLPPAGYPAAGSLPAVYQPLMPGAAPYPQPVLYQPGPNYPTQGYVHPLAGHGHAAPTQHAGGNLATGVAVHTISTVLASVIEGYDGGFSPVPGSDT